MGTGRTPEGRPSCAPCHRVPQTHPTVIPAGLQTPPLQLALTLGSLAVSGIQEAVPSLGLFPFSGALHWYGTQEAHVK